MTTPLAERLPELPASPGCYLFRARNRQVLYVGKAKSLRSRVRGYFQSSALHSPRIARMLQEADDLELIVTASEMEALILENSLIKKEQPRFNVLLRDDKNFPYLRLTVKDRFPRLVLVRRARNDGQLYFGPYLPASSARRTLRMASRYFKVAPCYEKLDGSRDRPCLYYHMDQCLGPCHAGLTTEEEYGRAVEDLRLFLGGRDRELLERLQAAMAAAAEREEYELAAHYRDLIRDIRRAARKQNFSSVGLEDQDYFHFHRERGESVLQVFQMRAGLVQARREFSFDSLDPDLPDDEFLAGAVGQYYAAAPEIPADVYVPLPLPGAELLGRWLGERRGGRVRLRVPRRGVRARFLDTVRSNASLAFRSRFRSGHTSGVRALEALREALDLEEAPYRIEGFDVSHMQGAFLVASVVVWVGGRAQRGEYRRFRVRTVEGQDDFASMAEVVLRRYRRQIREGRAMPDLVLVDGGKGQLAAAGRALLESGAPPTPIVSLAKREEAIFVPGRAEPIRLPRSSAALRLLQQVRDEAHRFAVSYHRNTRSRVAVSSALLSVPGVGPARARRLLRELGSLEGVRAASEAELSKVVPAGVARAVVAALQEPPEGTAG
ncbi:MAG: excinuclease ABC subunit UvrC [Acidobacteriota bacterium]